MRYKFSTLNRMFNIVDRVEKTCKEQGLYKLGEETEFYYEKDNNSKSISIKLYDGYKSFISVTYNVEKTEGNKTTEYHEYYKYSLKEVKKAFTKIKELLTEQLKEVRYF